MADPTLKLILIGEDKSAGKSLRNLGDEAEKTGGRLSRMGEIAGGVLGAQFMADAARAVVDFGASSVEAFRDAEQSQRKLEDAYKRFPAVTSVSIDALRELNSAIQAKTGADADDLASSQAVMAQYGLTGEQLQELTPLLDDYAVKTGKDLPAAAEDLGKAMLGQGRALKDVGIDFADTGSVAGNFNQVMAGLRTQVGGFAENESTSAEGALRRMQTEFGDVQEEVGAQLLPVLVSLGEVLLGVIGFVKENSEVLGPLAVGLGVVAGAVMAWQAAQALMNITLLANPVGLVVVAIAGLVAALIVAYNTSEDFRNAVNGEFDAVAEAARWLWNNGIAPVVRFIVNGFATIVDGIGDFLVALGNIPGFGWAADAGRAMKGAAAEARGLASSIRNIEGKKVNVDVAFRVINPGAVTAYTSGVMMPRADGGLVDFYASGGRRENHEAQYAPAGAWRVWAEPETEGEWYLPLARSKRSRTIPMWWQAGQDLGVVPFADGGRWGGGGAAAMGASPDTLARALREAIDGASVELRNGRLWFQSELAAQRRSDLIEARAR